MRDKVWLVGYLDREDGGYMSAVVFRVPGSIKTHQEAWDYMNYNTYFMQILLKNVVTEVYFEDLDREIETDRCRVKMTFDYGINFEFHYTENGEKYISKKTLAVDLIDAYGYGVL